MVPADSHRTSEKKNTHNWNMNLGDISSVDSTHAYTDDNQGC